MITSRLIKSLVITIVTSFYFFPFTFRFLPSVNTKMFLAGIGLFICAINLSKDRSAKIDRSFFFLSVAAALVSFAAILSAIVNDSRDYTYADYIVSMWVWLGGGYTVVQLIKWMYAKVTVEAVCKCLIAVCFLQCVLALLIDSFVSFKSFVDAMVADLGFIQLDRLDTCNRLYGIGCSLDVAGTRFAAILSIIPFLTVKAAERGDKMDLWGYLVAFVFIAIVGNMIARTSTIGILVAVIVWSVLGLVPSSKFSLVEIWKRFFIVVVIAILISVALYNTSYVFKTNIRFAFEGFFSLFETGNWETTSNNILMKMFILPDNIHTWLIGDGYLYDPAGINPYYVGDNYPGYYMNTDVGYIRFIFYFGIFGLFAIISYFIVITRLLAKRFTGYKMIFYTMLLINLIVWIKVSTDIFPVFAIFFCIPMTDDEKRVSSYENSLSDPLDI